QVPTRVIGWSEAEATVLTAYGAFSPKMAAIAERFFKNNWIDAPVRPGKAPGAFAHPTVPSAHPYVLLNYQGRPRDVMTLAHELGHGVHQVLAAPNGALMAPTPLTLAETASVFGDCLVNSLYAVYEQAAEGFAERYLKMLAAGGTKHHSELLAPFGLDARDPTFWQGGLGVIERMIGDLETLDRR